MVWRDRDPLTGAPRDALFLSADDAKALGVLEGQPLLVRAETGAELRARAHVAPIRAGNVQMFWPEANALIKQQNFACRGGVSGVEHDETPLGRGSLSLIGYGRTPVPCRFKEA